jgi:predicted Zn-dependent protease
LEEAAASFEKAVTLQPMYREARLNAIVAQFKRGDLERSIDLIEKYVSDFPHDAQGWDLRGTLQLQKNDMPSAMASGEKAVGLIPKNWKYRYNLALTYLQAEMAFAAIPILEEAVAMAPNEAKVQLALAGAYFRAADWRRAKALYADYLMKWPATDEAMRNLRKAQEILKLQREGE